VDSSVDTQLIRASDCPVCLGGSDACFVTAHGSGTVFVHCDACNCAWATVPTRVDLVEGPERFAPNGFRPATRDEIIVAGFAS
jgi:formate dehydrogenase maturation protein FdhE